MTWKLDRHEDLDLISNIRSEYSTNFYNFIISFIVAFTPFMLTMDRFSDQLFPHMESRLAVPNTIITSQIRPMFRWFHPELFLILWTFLWHSSRRSIILIHARWKLRRNSPLVENVANYPSCKFRKFLLHSPPYPLLIDLTFQRMECLWVECRLLRRLLVREVL